MPNVKSVRMVRTPDNKASLAVNLNDPVLHCKTSVAAALTASETGQPFRDTPYIHTVGNLAGFNANTKAPSTVEGRHTKTVESFIVE